MHLPGYPKSVFADKKAQNIQASKVQSIYAEASWFKKSSCNYPTNNRKFPTEEVMCAQNLNFTLKFPRNGGFQPQILHFWTKISRRVQT